MSGGEIMATKYPVILVHGIAMKNLKVIKAFGKIEKMLHDAGYEVYTADTDGFGSIETNAAQLKDYILGICDKCACEKVNIIAHSKGGLDSKYMITALGMEDRVASLTTLCTPHKGSIIASKIWNLPKPIKAFIAFWINLFYRVIARDKHPDALRACEQLRWVDADTETHDFSDKVYCQSFSTTLRKGRDCFLLAIPMRIVRRFDSRESDGMVCHESAKFGNYRGECIRDMSISHSQIIDIFAKKDQREKVYDFYKNLCRELTDMGF